MLIWASFEERERVVRKRASVVVVERGRLGCWHATLLCGLVHEPEWVCGHTRRCSRCPFLPARPWRRGRPAPPSPPSRPASTRSRSRCSKPDSPSHPRSLKCSRSFSRALHRTSSSSALLVSRPARLSLSFVASMSASRARRTDSRRRCSTLAHLLPPPDASCKPSSQRRRSREAAVGPAHDRRRRSRCRVGRVGDERRRSSSRCKLEGATSGSKKSEKAKS